MHPNLDDDSFEFQPKVCAIYLRVSSPQPKSKDTVSISRFWKQQDSIQRQKDQLLVRYKTLDLLVPYVFFIDDNS